MQAPFKDKVLRDDAPVYKILADVPKNANEGLHRVTFQHIDKKEKEALILDNHNTKPKSRLHQVSPCILNQTECSHANRQKAKLTNKQ